MFLSNKSYYEIVCLPEKFQITDLDFKLKKQFREKHGNIFHRTKYRL